MIVKDVPEMSVVNILPNILLYVLQEQLYGEQMITEFSFLGGIYFIIEWHSLSKL